MENKSRKKYSILGISIWRILAYFIIYSFIGYIIETIFSIVVYGVIDSRQSFLYGPFCGIYGIGAIIMILLLQYFNKNNHTLFLAGTIIGAVIEYLLSFVGELMLGVRWWDYSDKFLNINGRICLIYSFFWGFLAIYLIKVLNPRVDRFIDYLAKKLNPKVLKTKVIIVVVVLFLDCVISAIAIDVFLTKVSVENNLDIENKQSTIEKYNKIYTKEGLVKFIERFWSDEKMIKTYPKLKITLENSEIVYVQEFFKNIQPYYYKFPRNLKFK